MKLPDNFPFVILPGIPRDKPFMKMPEEFIEAIVRDCAARCERRAQSLREGAAVARQCGQDILAGYGLEPQ